MINNKLNLGIVGSRKRNSEKDFKLIYKKIIELNPNKIISGGCKIGADYFAEKISNILNISMVIFEPDFDLYPYEKFKNKAYFMRNMKIAEYSNILIAVVSSDRIGGTENTIKWFLQFNTKNNLILL